MNGDILFENEFQTITKMRSVFYTRTRIHDVACESLDFIQYTISISIYYYYYYYDFMVVLVFSREMLDSP